MEPLVIKLQAINGKEDLRGLTSTVGLALYVFEFVIIDTVTIIGRRSKKYLYGS